MENRRILFIGGSRDGKRFGVDFPFRRVFQVALVDDPDTVNDIDATMSEPVKSRIERYELREIVVKDTRATLCMVYAIIGSDGSVLSSEFLEHMGIADGTDLRKMRRGATNGMGAGRR